MPTVIATSDIPSVTGYGNQRKIDRCQNGTLWVILPRNFDSSTAGWNLYYSEDNGTTWTYSGSISVSGTGNSYTPNASLFIDLDDYAHVVYKDRSNGIIYYRRGTPNSGRTAWTWSSEAQVFTAYTTLCNYPDIIAHRENTGWVAHIVASNVASDNSGQRAVYDKVSISSSGTITVAGKTDLSDFINGIYNGTVPSIDFNHTGDGKIVAGGTPHLYVAWNFGNSGAGKGLRFKKATYAAGAWTWSAEVGINDNQFVSSVDNQWINCLFDGTRVIIGGTIYEGGNINTVLHDRDAANTTTTNRTPLSAPATSEQLQYGSLSYDSEGNVYFYGRNSNESSGTRDFVYRKWVRDTNTLESEVVVDPTTDSTYASAKRGHSNNRIEVVYISDTAYNVSYDSISLNSVPATPTDLTVTSDVLDNTPVFSASVSDPDTSQQIKGRFQIYQNDGTTLVGTIDSALRTGAGTVTAEYASALPVGTYKVQAATVDDAGAVSAYTAQTTFYVKTTVTQDEQFIWDTDALINVNSDMRWDVLVANQKDFSFSWHIKQEASTEKTFFWNDYPIWTPVDADAENNPVTWERVMP